MARIAALAVIVIALIARAVVTASASSHDTDAYVIRVTTATASRETSQRNTQSRFADGVRIPMADG